MHTLQLTRAYMLAKRVMERRIIVWKEREPWVHAAVMAARILDRSPTLWRVYQAGIAAGLSAEFQHARPVRTERDRLWQRIEDAGRKRVAKSSRPLTLRNAVIAVVKTKHGRALYRAYANALPR